MSNSLATDFAGMVLAQLVRRGSFCIGSSDVCFMEPATGGIGNFVQTSLADMVMCQVRRDSALPSFTGIGGHSRGAALRSGRGLRSLTTNLMQAFYSRRRRCDYLGSLDQGMTYSLHALLLCDDLAGLLRTLWQGVRIDARCSRWISRARSGRAAITSRTGTPSSHCREQLWHTPLLRSEHAAQHRPPSGQGPAAADRCDLRRLVAQHRARPMAADLEARLRAIRDRFFRGCVQGLTAAPQAKPTGR